jgi:hypothetical protein
VRRKKSRLSCGTVYVLGAGASHAATLRSKSSKVTNVAPLDRDFCARILQLEDAKPKWVRDAVRRVTKHWRDHRPFDSFGLEEAIITQLGYSKLFDGIYKRRGGSTYRDIDFISDISHLVAFELSRSRESSANVYQRLAKAALPEGWSDSLKNRIITFNYDTLFDTHLIKYGVPPHKLYFDRISESASPKKFRSENKFENPLLIKLHGSVNWFCDRSDFESILNGKETPGGTRLRKIWLQQEDEPVPNTKESFAPCLVPPVPSKPITRLKLFNWLWTKAAEYLSEASEIVIAGYSLPATDNLAWSLFGAIKNDSLTQISIIDPNPVIWRKWKDLLARPTLGSKPSWRFFSTFEEYFDEVQLTESDDHQSAA